MKCIMKTPKAGFISLILIIIALSLASCAPEKAPVMKDDNIMHTGMKMNNGQTTMPMDMASDKAMMDDLNQKTGDDFDKAFLAIMIQHHRQALAMAERAKRVAKHDEIKKLAGEIIAAQAKEIEQMREWYKAWGYPE
jgi:uncharacterized protein (DUF305 family)